MKTAMKKLFSLMLVAVLLVGVMPFQAFADGAPYYQIISPSEGNKVLESVGNLENRTFDQGEFAIPSGYTFDYATKNGNPVSFPVELGDGDVLLLLVNPVSVHTHTPGAAATCTNPQTCTGCGEVLNAATGHTAGAAATCTTAQTCTVCGAELNAALGHNVVGGECTRCDYTEEVAEGCTDCWVDPCICCAYCNGTTVEHAKNCPLISQDNNEKTVTLILDYNYEDAEDYEMEVPYEGALKDIIAGIAAPTREGYLFSGWTLDAAGKDTIDVELATAQGVRIYAQWVKNMSVDGDITLRVNWNYKDDDGDPVMGESITNIPRGTKMGTVMDYIKTPTRTKYKFLGWYWERECENKISSSQRIYADDVIFAKWERRTTDNEIMLKIYLNGHTDSVAKIVDMYDYSHDGWITKSEVKSVVKKYYSAKNSNGMSYFGLFTEDNWNLYAFDPENYTGGKSRIEVKDEEDGNTVVYVMVTNAKSGGSSSSSSSATADSSNPKTGDMIFTAVTVMGASVTCLAALFFLKKKRAHEFPITIPGSDSCRLFVLVVPKATPWLSRGL